MTAPTPTSVTSGPVGSAQPVAAARVTAGAAPRGRVGSLRDGRERLVDRPGGQAEVGGGSVGPAELRERMQQRPLEVLPKRGLPGDAARLLEPDRRRDDRLVRAALWRQRDARRGADEDRLAAGVHAERPRLERAVHERVIQRADRQQRLTVARPGRAELAEQADEVALGDPELDVLAVLGSRASARACRCRRRTSRSARRGARSRPG